MVGCWFHVEADEEIKEHCNSFDQKDQKISLSRSFENPLKDSVLLPLKKQNDVWQLIEKEIKRSRIFGRDDIEAMESIRSESFQDFLDSLREYWEKFTSKSPLLFETDHRRESEGKKEEKENEPIVTMSQLREQLTSISQHNLVVSKVRHESIRITDFIHLMMNEKTPVNDPCIISFFWAHDVLDISPVSLFLKLVQLFFAPMKPGSLESLDHSCSSIQSQKRVMNLLKTWYKSRRRDILTCPKTTYFWQEFFQLQDVRSLLQCVKIDFKNQIEWNSLYSFHTKRKAEAAASVLYQGPRENKLTKLSAISELMKQSPLHLLREIIQISLDDFCKINSKTIADVMTFIDASYLFNLSINDLKSNAKEWSYLHPLYIKRYNSLMVWARIFILKQDKPANRLRAIRKYIEVMSFLSNSKYCNLESISILYNVLSSPVITRLTKTWKPSEYLAKITPYSQMVTEWKEKIIHKKPGVAVLPPFHKIQGELNILSNYRPKYKDPERQLCIDSWYEDYSNLISRFSVVQKDSQTLTYVLKECKKHQLYGLFNSQLKDGMFNDHLIKSIPKEINFLSQYSSAEFGFEDMLVRFSELVEAKS